MRNEIPILKFSSYTPKPVDIGLFLNASRFHGGIETNAVWMHGLLVLEPAELLGKGEQHWLDALNLVAVSESNQLPLIAKIMGNRTLVQNHSAESTLKDGRTVRALPFSFDLKDVLGHGLFNDNFYIHISAHQYCSKPIRIVRDDASQPTYLEQLETAAPQFNEINQLIKGYDSYSAGRFSEALEYFDKVLGNEEIRRNIDRPNLYNAGYCASQFSLDSEPSLAKQLLDKTTNWMQEDLKIRNALLMDIQTKLLSEKDTVEIANLEHKRLQLLQDLGLIKSFS